MRRGPVRYALLCAALVAVPGCAGNSLGALGDILGGAAGMPSGTASAGQLNVEIRQLDTRQQLMQVATADGQVGVLHYDQNTVVVYRQQQYPVTALERGDVAVIQVQQDARGNYYAQRIDVTQSVQERTGQTGASSVQQFAGTVGQIDHDRGLFLLQTQSGSLTVAVPYNAAQTTVDTFRRLRVGHNVRIEAVLTGQGQAQVRRFY